MRKFLITALVLLAILLVGFWFWGGRKTSDIQDADLKPERPVLAPEKNAWSLLERATNELVWPAEHEAELQKIISKTAENPELVSQILRDNQKALATLEEILALGQLQVPPDTNDATDSVRSARNLVRVLRLQSQNYARLEKREEALQAVWKILALSQMVEKANGPLIFVLSANNLKGLALQSAARVSELHPLPGPEVKKFVARLDAYRSDSGSLSNALKTEYQSQCFFFDELKAGRMYGTNMNRLGIGFGPPLYHHRNTRLFLLAETRKTLKSVPGFYSEMKVKTSPLPKQSMRTLVRGNWVGEIMSQMVVDLLPSSIKSKCRNNSQIGATSIILALHSFEKERGQLPARLEELVPDYLSRIPLDDFDGKPLRYSREKMIVYSVGPDLKDSNGDSKRDLDDIPFSIKPKATALEEEAKDRNKATQAP